MAYFDSMAAFVSSIGWALLFLMLNLCVCALFMVLYSLHQYLRDRNQREASDARARMLMADAMARKRNRGGVFPPPPLRED